MERRHKIILGGASSLVVALLITTSLFTSAIFIRQTLEFSKMNNEMDLLRADTQNKLNELTDSVLSTKSDLQAIDFLTASTSEDFSAIVEDATKSVVTLKTEVGAGTGFIISEDGLIVTNAHVLTGGNTLTILDYKQEKLPGQFIGYDLDMDVVVIKVLGTYNYLELADSDEVQIGEAVIAIGNPLGLQFSVSEGIVSGVNRDGISNEGIYIQTDAALNPGNSGGPLINKQGKVIGINNFKISGTDNIGFALESNALRESVNQIISGELNKTI